MSALVVGTALFATPPLTNAATGTAIRDARLVLPFLYSVLAPICNVLDTISFFSLRQHFAFLATCALAYAAWRFWRAPSETTRRARSCKECLLAGLALLSVVTLYAGGTLLPRPIVRLAMASPNSIVVDFHSHTSYSWDGRAEFTPEENRRWHQASGIDAAYVTDHGTFAGAVEAATQNPSRAGDGTVLLSGIEVRSTGRHLDILGTGAQDSAAYASDDLDAKRFMEIVRARKSVPPVVLLTLPGNLRPARNALPIDAVEISDGAPRALAQIDAQRERILGLAQQAGVAIVAGSNNHGWARALPSWSVMDIPGWRSMTPSELDNAIRETLLQRGYGSVQVIERRPVGPVSPAALALTVPLAIWRMLVTVSWTERFSWLCWIWLGYLVLGRLRVWARAAKRLEYSVEGPLYEPLGL